MRCPHQDCGRKFDQLIMIVDHSKVPRDTYYACPHCKSRIDIVFERESLKFNNRSRNIPREKQSACPYYFGYLKLFTRGAQIPEACMMCPKLVECTNKKI